VYAAHAAIVQMKLGNGLFEASGYKFVWSVMHGLAGILRGDAVNVLEIPGPMLESAVPFALERIGAAHGSRGDGAILPLPVAA
jgi:hypothetical protein